jgi:hypothetical protein
VRVYLPTTVVGLRSLAEHGALGPAPLTGFAVTAALREWYLDEDLEALEYAAMVEAARGSLRLLDGDFAAPRRRVVIALEVPESTVQVRDDLERGVVRLSEEVTLRQVMAIHLDDADAEPTVAAAAAAVIAADLGSKAAQDTVDDAEGFELSWFATQELAGLLDTL